MLCNDKLNILSVFKVYTFEFIDSLKKNGTKYLQNIDESCEEICNSKVFVGTCTDWRHRGLSTVCIRHNLFHRSKLGWEVELRNTNLVLFKSPVIWCKSVHSVHNWATYQICLTGIETQRQLPTGIYRLNWRRVQTTDYVIVQKNDPSHQNFFISDRLKKLNSLHSEHTKLLYSPTIPIIFPQMQKPFPLFLSKKIIRFLSKCIVNLFRGTLQNIIRHLVAKSQSEMCFFSPESTILKQRRDVPASEKRFHLKKSLLLQSLKICLDVEQFFSSLFLCTTASIFFSVCYKAGTSKLSNWPKSHVPNCLVEKGN